MVALARSTMFVGMFNEFGDLFSSALAGAIGATTAVVLGGFGTLAVVPVAACLWSEIRRLREIRPLDETAPGVVEEIVPDRLPAKPHS